MTLILQLAAAFVGSVGFAILFSVKKSHLIWGGLGGVLAWLVFCLLEPLVPSDVVRYAITAALFTIYAELMAKYRHSPAIVFIVPSAVPLFPGSSLYYTMEAAVVGDSARFAQKGIHTLALAAGLACGILVTMTLVNVIKSRRWKAGRN